MEVDHDRAVLEKVPFEWAPWEAAEIAPNTVLPDNCVYEIL